MGKSVSRFKTTNDYAKLLSFYAECPKAVLAALAVSLTHALETGDDPSAALAKEWEILHLNGIVPQRPPADVRALVKQDEQEM